jgi:hypothetical protein
MNDWTDKIAENIGRNKGQSEITLFMDEGNTQVSFARLNTETLEGNKRLWIAQIIGLRLEKLKELQKRL